MSPSGTRGLALEKISVLSNLSRGRAKELEDKLNSLSPSLKRLLEGNPEMSLNSDVLEVNFERLWKRDVYMEFALATSRFGLVPGLLSPRLPYFSKTNPFRPVRHRLARDLFDFNLYCSYDCLRPITNPITRCPP